MSDPLELGDRIYGIDWKDMEPQPGVYNFADIGAAINQAAAANKVVRLSFNAGTNAPAWLTDPKGAFRVPEYHANGGEGESFTTPAVWNLVYRARLARFIAALGAYVNAPNFASQRAIKDVYVPGGPNYVEMITTGRQTTFDAARAVQTPYTRQGYRDAWIAALDETAKAFPDQQIIVNLSQTWDETLPPTTAGVVIDDWVATQVGDYAAARYPTRIELQNASVPLIYAQLTPYFKAMASRGIEITAQIDWQHVATKDAGGRLVRTPATVCNAIAIAHSLGATTIEINFAAYTDPALRPILQAWAPTLTFGASAPACPKS